MKKMVFAIAAALTISLGAMAQEEQELRRERAQMNQSEMIQRRTDETVKKYGLNDEQAQKLLELNKQFLGKMRPQRDMQRRQRPDRANARPDSAQARRPEPNRQRGEEMRKNMEEYNTGLQKILTEEQYKAYQEDMKNRPQRDGRGPRRGGGRQQ